MIFSELNVGDKFYFFRELPFVKRTLYRKISDKHYTYDSDRRGIWKYYAPPNNTVHTFSNG